MWASGIDRPYYPSVKFYKTKTEAQQEYKKLIKEESEQDGHYHCSVFIAKVEAMKEILTSY